MLQNVCGIGKLPKNGSIFMSGINMCGALVQQLVEEGKLLCSGLESTTSAIESNDLGVGKVRSTLDGGLM
ncbi:hypothetical protein Tco_1035064 [Tanacetum coccineum]